MGRLKYCVGHGFCFCVSDRPSLCVRWCIHNHGVVCSCRAQSIMEFTWERFGSMWKGSMIHAHTRYVFFSGRSESVYQCRHTLCSEVSSAAHKCRGSSRKIHHSFQNHSSVWAFHQYGIFVFGSFQISHGEGCSV